MLILATLTYFIYYSISYYTGLTDEALAACLADKVVSENTSSLQSATNPIQSIPLPQLHGLPPYQDVCPLQPSVPLPDQSIQISQSSVLATNEETLESLSSSTKSCITHNLGLNNPRLKTSATLRSVKDWVQSKSA